MGWAHQPEGWGHPLYQSQQQEREMSIATLLHDLGAQCDCTTKYECLHCRAQEHIADERIRLDQAMAAIGRLGHTKHCAHRLAFGDGECECQKRA